MGRIGFEPMTYGLWDHRSYRWTNGPNYSRSPSLRWTGAFYVVVVWDFEPQRQHLSYLDTNNHTIFWIVVDNSTGLGYRQTLTLEYYRIPFNPFFFARFTACRLLELYLLVLFSYLILRIWYVTILQMNKPFFSLKSYTLLLLN